jgi:hypothetical protein
MHRYYGGRASNITGILRKCWRRSFPRRWPPSPSCWPITTRKQIAQRRQSPIGIALVSKPSSTQHT